MLRLRPYKPADAEAITSWCKDERTFLLWGGNLFGSFPINAEIMNRKYLDENGGCEEKDNFYPMTAFDDSGTVGHFIMRYTGGNTRNLRFGWVIVDSEKRGKKYGQQMLKLGLQYAFEILKVDLVTIGVYENNASAYGCYRALGFREAQGAPEVSHDILGEQIKVIELVIRKEEYQK